MCPVNDDNKKKYEDIIQNEFPNLIRMLNKHLNFKRWGFELTHAGVFPQYLPYIIYQSDQCKIRVKWEQDRPYESPSISINYGRLHAPVDQHYMLWNGEDCYCWHEIGMVLNFLDGLSLSSTSNSNSMVPREMSVFFEKNKNLAYQNQYEYVAKQNAHIWSIYGQRLFNLFDLRHPDLWNDYRDFLKKFYSFLDERNKLKGIPPSPVKPPLYQVC